MYSSSPLPNPMSPPHASWTALRPQAHLRAARPLWCRRPSAHPGPSASGTALSLIGKPHILIGNSI